MRNLDDLDIDRNERHERLLAEADNARFAKGFALAQTWQCRLRTQIGHWLIVDGRRLESNARRAESGAA